jgi:hypothetical protein
MVATMSNPFVALRVNVITKVYCVPLAYPVLPLVAPFARGVQTLGLLEDSIAELVPGAVLSSNRNGVPPPNVVAMFINMA